METFIVRYKIKKGFVPGIKMWGKELSRRKKDVLETLKNEKVFVECAFIDSIAGENYLVYFMKCANIKEIFKQLKKSKLSIDIFHKEVLSKYLEEPVYLEKVIDFENIPLLK